MTWIHFKTIKNFFFFSFLLSLSLFLHACFNVFSVLSLSVSRNAYILCRFHTINNQIPDPDGSSNIEQLLQLADKFIVSDVCQFAELRSQVYLLFLALETRCSARHSTFPTVCKKQRWPNLKPDIQMIQLHKR